MKEILNKVLSKDLLDEMNITDWGHTNDPIASSWSKFDDWVSKGHNGNLKYLEGERKDKRQSLEKYFPEFESAIVFQFSYTKEKFQLDEFYKSKESNGLKIASYVLGFEGVDYHFGLKENLERIGELLKKEDPTLEYKLSLDIQPVLERDLAYRAGLGWFGKNSMFISKSNGSFFILGSLLLNKKIDLDPIKVETDHCGQCTRCIDACPTQAIDISTRTIISNKCISTFTIEEFKDNVEAPSGMELAQGEIFGCDICQDVCPWNTRLKRINKYESKREFSKEYSFIANFFLKRPLEQIISELNSLSNRKFQKLFFKTPLQRTGRIGLLKNLLFYSNKKR
jgi:epoxyqueuosine reductase